MAFSEFTDLFKSFLMLGPNMWIGNPDIPKLRVTNVQMDNNTLTINLKCWDDQSGTWSKTHIRIEQANTKPRIVSAGFEKELVEEPMMDSRMISLFMLTLPITLPISPILLIRARQIRKEEEKRGMSRQSIETLRQLQKQLHPKVTVLLEQAMKNHFQWRKMIAESVERRENHDAWL